MLSIIKAGLASSIQDVGRLGWAQQGISRCGALDQPGMQMANLLVGNPVDTGVIEITQGNVLFRFDSDCWFALTGASCNAMLNELAIVTGWRHRAMAGQYLRLASPSRGVRSYLAIAGGFDLATKMGSLSTDLKAGFGGYQGRLLLDGDRLPLPANRRTFIDSVGIRQILWANRVRVLPGPEYHEFSHEAQAALWRTGWRLTAQNNRLGYRLQGRQLQRRQQRDILSHAVLPGTIQVPASGQPLVLLADAQTTGGYPRIGQVIDCDLYHLAQLRLGEPLHFIYCTFKEATQAARAQQQVLDMIQWGLERTDENRS